MTARCSTRAYLLTPSGTGAIGVVRLAGPQAESVALRFFHPHRAGQGPSTPGRLRYGSFVVDGEHLDDVIVCSSVIAEERVVDFCAHGGIRILERLLAAFSTCGVGVILDTQEGVHPWPVMNLIESEAAHALASARTGRAVRFLARQYCSLPNAIQELAALCLSDPSRADHLMGQLLGRYANRRPLINGATVSLIGPTNAGKSTLFNRLVGRKATIVSAVAGTTRDWTSAPIELAGVGIDLIDTAGVCKPGDVVDWAAVREGHRRARAADLRLILLDGSTSNPQDWIDTLDVWLAMGPALLIRTKADLPAAWSFPTLPGTQTMVRCVSAHSGLGVAELADAIERAICPGQDGDTFVCVFTQRQVILLRQAREALTAEPAEAARLLRSELMGPEPPQSRVQP